MSTTAENKVWQNISLGFKGIPYPTACPDGSLALSTSHVPVVLSQRSSEHVNGIAFRDMPAPEHMSVFLNVLDSIHAKGRRVITLLSDPGIGKTVMADILSKMMMGERSLRYECGDKRLGNLLFTTDLAERPEQSLYDRVLQQAKQGSLHPLSLMRLKVALGGAFDQKTGEVNWEAVLTENNANEIGKLFEDVAKSEGLSQQSSIALREHNGLIIKAYEQNRIGLADEYNKGKPGTDTALQTVLQWLAREGESEITVESNSGRSYNLGNLEAKNGFYMVLTGNAVTDGIGTFELSQSQQSRLQPYYLSNLGQMGLSHRFCQIMTGLPVSTLYRLYGSHFENAEDNFILFCQNLRTMGLTSEEVEKIPAHQIALLKQPQQVIKAADQCADFFMRWKAKTDLDNPNITTSLMSELTDDYVKATTPDPRMFIMLFNRALERVQRQAIRDTNINPSYIMNALTQQDIAAKGSLCPLGNAMMELVAEEIVNKTAKQPNLRGLLMSDAEELGVIPSKASGKNNDLSKLLNVTIERTSSISENPTGDLIKAWGSIFGGTSFSQIQNHITPHMQSLEHGLTRMKASGEHFISFISDPSKISYNNAQGPFILTTLLPMQFEIKNDEKYLVNDQDNTPFSPDRLLTESQLVASLTIPGNEEAFGKRYMMTSGSNSVNLQVISALVLDDHDLDADKPVVILRSEATPLPAGSAPRWKDDIRPSTIVLGKGDLSSELMERLEEVSEKPNRQIITYINLENGITTKQIMDMLRRDESTSPELAKMIVANLSDDHGLKASEMNDVSVLLQKVLTSATINNVYLPITCPNQTQQQIKSSPDQVKGAADSNTVGMIRPQTNNNAIQFNRQHPRP